MEVDVNEQEMSEIIEAYTEALINTKHIVGKVSELPYNKDVIADVLLEAYRSSDNEEEKAVLEEAYLKLESFLDDKDFEALSEYITVLAELQENEQDQEKVFEMAVEQIPETANEVLEILQRIEDNLKTRKASLTAH